MHRAKAAAPSATAGAFAVRGPGVVPPKPAKQARSRKTLAHLLAAAEAVLEEKGLDGATVPVIARRAGLSVGVVYRRFPDKDALLRATYEAVFARVREGNRWALSSPALETMPLHLVIRMVIQGMLAGYRKHRGLLTALHLYALTHKDRAFRRRAEQLNNEAMGLFQSLMLRRRRELKHPNPAMAVHFGLLAVTLAVRGLMLGDEHALARFAPPADRLADELILLYENYLGMSAAERRRLDRARAKGLAQLRHSRA